MRPNITSKSMDFTNVRVTLVQVTNDFRHGQTKQRSLNLLGHIIAEMLLLDTTQRYGSIVEVGFYRGLPGPSKFSSNPTPPSRRSSQNVHSAIQSVNPVGPSSRSIQKVFPSGGRRQKETYPCDGRRPPRPHRCSLHAHRPIPK